MILYKYLHPDRLNDLHSRLIRFTQPNAFNDPFDSQPCFDLLLPRAVIEEVCGGNEQPGDGEAAEEREGKLKFQAEILDLLGLQKNKDWYLANTVNRIAILCLAQRADNKRGESEFRNIRRRHGGRYSKIRLEEFWYGHSIS